VTYTLYGPDRSSHSSGDVPSIVQWTKHAVGRHSVPHMSRLAPAVMASKHRGKCWRISSVSSSMSNVRRRRWAGRSAGARVVGH